MRGIGNHTPPASMQPAPPNNTSPFINRQIVLWGSPGYHGNTDVPVIHTEVAREIAAWWQSSNYLGLAFAAFQSSGTIQPNLLVAIDYELAKGQDAGDVDALKALRAYVIEAHVAADEKAEAKRLCGCGAAGDHDETHEAVSG